ncbi:cytidylate kinase family protein [Patescibacteria group bacterium]|nr:cytidylate kinase family protein [Patescibacteria group bacterium]
MIITLAGYPGAGKTTVKDILAKRLGYKSYSMGDLRGKMAISRGITIDELNEIGMQDPSTDKDADAFQIELAKAEDNFIIDGWLSWHFIPQSFKVFLNIDPAIGAKRILAERQQTNNREDERAYATVEEAQKALENRVNQSKERYKKWYNADFSDLGHYDLVIDTANLTPTEVTEQILKNLPTPATA